jgi:hypothetical protein
MAQGKSATKKPVAAPKAVKEAKAPVEPKAKKVPELHPCGDGCGAMVKGRFLPGHDAKLKGRLLQVVYKSGEQKDVDEALAELEANGWTRIINAKKAQRGADHRSPEYAALMAKPVKDPKPAAIKKARAFEDEDIEAID